MSYGLTQKWRHIADVIRSEIDRQLYRPGDQLPTVVILAERFGVNRHTVRRALDSLQQSGLVSMEQGRGTFVADTRVTHRPAERIALSLDSRPLEVLQRLSTAEAKATNQRLLLEKIQPTPELRNLFGAGETEAFWHLRILTHLGSEPLCLSNHYLRVRRFADLDASLLRGGHDVATSLAEHGFNQVERQETSLQAAMASPDQKHRLEISDNHPLLITSGLDRDAKSQELLQYVVTAWPSQRIYVLHDHAGLGQNPAGLAGLGASAQNHHVGAAE
jgi:GntR family phosphonate transport system transcriptional regulator